MEKKDKISTMRAAKAEMTAENTHKKKAVRKRNTQIAALVEKTAELTGVSKRHVRRVINGTNENEGVLLVYMELQEGGNKLMNAVKALVPFAGYQDIELEVGYKKFS